MISVRYYWKNENAYIVFISSETLINKYFYILSETDKQKLNEVGDIFLTNNLTINSKGLLPKNCYLLLVRSDSTIQIIEPTFPFAGMWNAYNPLIKTKSRKIKKYPELMKIFS